MADGGEVVTIVEARRLLLRSSRAATARLTPSTLERRPRADVDPAFVDTGWSRRSWRAAAEHVVPAPLPQGFG
jgi:hypothetical protein